MSTIKYEQLYEEKKGEMNINKKEEATTLRHVSDCVLASPGQSFSCPAGLVQANLL